MSRSFTVSETNGKIKIMADLGTTQISFYLEDDEALELADKIIGSKMKENETSYQRMKNAA